MLRLERERRRAFRIRIALAGSIGLAALAAFVPAWNFLSSEAAQSGFAQFASLVFSDFSVVTAYWKDFLLSLLESLPVYGSLAVLGSLFAFGLSLRSLSNAIIQFSAPSMRFTQVSR
jgi:ABC-type phosphate/phosphonate transport system permease subunit